MCANTIPYTGNTNPGRAATIHPTTKNIKISLTKILARIKLFLFLVEKKKKDMLMSN